MPSPLVYVQPLQVVAALPLSALVGAPHHTLYSPLYCPSAVTLMGAVKGTVALEAVDVCAGAAALVAAADQPTVGGLADVAGLEGAGDHAAGAPVGAGGGADERGVEVGAHRDHGVGGDVVLGRVEAQRIQHL